MKFLIVIFVFYCGFLPSETAECESKIAPGSPEIYFLHVKSYIKNRYASTNVVSKLVNPSNKSQEVYFYMNLPESAFITSFVMEINGKEYEAYIKEKEEAKQIYDEALQSGLSAGHVAASSRDSNNFKISVNIESKGKVRFTLKYEEFLQRTLGVYKHIINLNPGQTVRDLKVEVYIDESSEIKDIFVPEIKVSNEIDTDEKENKDTQINRPNKKTAHIKYNPSIEDQEKIAGKCFDGQFIVNYDVDRSNNCGQILINDGYFVHFFAPEGLQPLRKLVVFVLDLSGSMYGRKLVQMKDAMNTILDDLDEKDFFSIVEFSYSVTLHNLDSPTGSAVITPESIYRDPELEQTSPSLEEVQQSYQASKQYITKAKQVINKMTAGGGTNIHDALKTAVTVSQKALEKLRTENNDTNQFVVEPIIVFLTDGEPTVGVTNLNSIQIMLEEVNDPKTSIFSLGFGNGADMNFLKKISLDNAGFARTIYEAADAALQLKRFYKQISSPLLSNVTFNYLPEQVNDETLTTKHFQSLFKGSELYVAGKLVDNNVDLKTNVHSISSNGSDKCTLEITPTKLDTNNESDGNPELTAFLSSFNKEEKKKIGSLERLWAYLTTKQLIDQQEVSKVTINDTQSDNNKKKALDLALKYNFVTSLTSLVVVKPNQSEAVTDLTDSMGDKSQDPYMTSFAYRPSLVAGNAYPMAALGPPRAPMRTYIHAAAAAVYPPGSMMLNAFGSPVRKTATYNSPYTSTAVSFDRMDISYAEVASFSLRNLTLSDLEWLDQVLENDNQTISIPDKNSNHVYNLLTKSDNTTFQECMIKQNISGECTHLVNCVLSEFTSDFQEFLEYFCILPGNYAGVCCPNDTTSESTETTLIVDETTTIVNEN